MINYYLPPAPSTHPWWPAWSPDGKWIAFARYGSIWKIAPGDSVAYELKRLGFICGTAPEAFAVTDLVRLC